MKAKTMRSQTFGVIAAIATAMLALAFFTIIPVVHQEAWALGKDISILDANGHTIENVTVGFDEDSKEVTLISEQDIPCIEVNVKDIDGHRIGYATVEEGSIKAKTPLTVSLQMNKLPAKVVIVSPEAADKKPPAKIVGTVIIVIGAVIAVISYRKLYRRH